MVLWSASVERFSVSCMQDFYKAISKTKFQFNISLNNFCFQCSLLNKIYWPRPFKSPFQIASLLVSCQLWLCEPSIYVYLLFYGVKTAIWDTWHQTLRHYQTVLLFTKPTWTRWNMFVPTECLIFVYNSLLQCQSLVSADTSYE